MKSNSELSCFRECPRKYFHKYIQLRRPREEAKALAFGKTFHELLAHWWLRDYTAIRPVIEAVEDPYDRVKMAEMMHGYHIRWEGDACKYIDVEVELEFCVNIPGVDEQLGGKLDLRLTRDDKRLFGEHKTSSEDITPGSDYWKKLRLNTQVSLYALALDLDGCLYDVIKKPALKPLKANGRRAHPEPPDEYAGRIREDIAGDPDKYYQRAIVYRDDEAMATAHEDLLETLKLLAVGAYPRNPDSCFRWFRPCEYWDVCTGADTILNDLKFRTADKAHEELQSTA